MSILVFSLHKVTCDLKIKVIYDLTPWDGGPRHLPTNRKPSPPAPGYQQNSEKWWPYKIFTIIFWAIQSPHPYMMQLQRAARARSNRWDAVQSKNYFTFSNLGINDSWKKHQSKISWLCSFNVSFFADPWSHRLLVKKGCFRAIL